MYRPPESELERDVAIPLFDFHCRILRGVDDGAPDMDSSLEPARAMLAEAAGRWWTPDSCARSPAAPLQADTPAALVEDKAAGAPPPPGVAPEIGSGTASWDG